MKGIIKKKVVERGFGFITGEGMDKDVFFHSNSVVGTTFDELQEGEAVTFETEEVEKGGEKKLNAINVQRAG